MRRIVVISDTQIPYHSEKAVSNLVKFIWRWKPDEVIHIGDLMDYPTPSTWSKDTRAEFAGSVKEDSEVGKAFLGSIREGYEGPINVLPSNHDERPEKYLAKYAPALDEFKDAFSVEKLLDFSSFGVEMTEGFYDFADGWTATHGHLGFTLSQVAGGTARLASMKIGRSVVMGHTHRLGLIGQTTGYRGNSETRWGFEVGHLMDVKKAGYIMGRSGGYANWQQGFGIFYIDGDKVFPKAIPVMKDGSFEVDGYLFPDERKVIAA